MNEEEKSELKRRLMKEFEIKSLGKLKYFLSIVVYSAQGIFISKQKYVMDLLMEIGKSICKPAPTPMDPHQKLGESKEQPAVTKKCTKG